MKLNRSILLLTLLALTAFTPAPVSATGAPGKYFVVDYAPSAAPGKLQLGVTYTLWVPSSAKALRGVIVHQHGCGEGACKSGETAAYDLQWQALARRWDCALLSPFYHQSDKQDCTLWCDPRKGSQQTFLRAIKDFSAKSGHPELERVPWCLWGHSGGGVWASLVQALHPDRIVAIWLRSGAWPQMAVNSRVAPPQIPASAYQVPVMVNTGVKEKGHKQFDRIWQGTLAFFRDYRSRGALIGLAPDPTTGHDCGLSRTLAIPFFDVCLSMRLPEVGSADQKLKPMDARQAFLATPLQGVAVSANGYRGKATEAVWLPNARIARMWAEYVKTGAVKDHIPPTQPFSVMLNPKPGKGVELTWDVYASRQGGLAGFVIQRDGKDLATLPEKPARAVGGRMLFQGLSYHDTPEKPLPEMKFLDATAGPGEHEYRVIAVSGDGLRSEPARPLNGR